MLDKTNSDFKIIAYSKKYFEQWRDLYTKTTQRQQPGNYFVFNTSETPFGKPIQFLMKHKDKIVGSHTIRPLQFRIKGKNVLGGMTHDSLTDPDYQNMGIFTALAKETHREAKRQNYQLVCGYANSNSIGIYQKQLQHKKLQDINFIKLTDFEKVEEVGRFGFGRKKIPPNFPESLLHEKNEQFACSVNKSMEYLKWRYEQKHHQFYRVFFHPERFLIITKQYEKQLQIIDFFAMDADAFRTALTIVYNIAKFDNIPDLTMWVPVNHPHLEESGIKYETLKAKQFFHIISFNDDNTESIMDLNNWNYSMGDSDVF